MRITACLLLVLSMVLCFTACSKGGPVNDPDSASGVANTAPSYPSGSEDLVFTLNADGASYSVYRMGDCTDLDVVVPQTYNDLPVTAIAKLAFNNTNITSITLPASVVTIGEYAFRACEGLTLIRFYGTMEQWAAVEMSASRYSETYGYTISCNDGNIKP